jgi:asparagine synthetase B (glutamine-hydrolysing)
MGDFLLDFRDRVQRCRDANQLRFYPDMEVDQITRDGFSLFVSRFGCADIWAPFESAEGLVVALAGNVALEESEWESASRVEGKGGLACKAIYLAYRSRGINGLYNFSGGCAIHVYDPQRGAYYLVTDRAGAFPCYGTTVSDELFCSHPDVLAGLLPKSMSNSPSKFSSVQWDLESMAQFIATGAVSFPHSFYLPVSALDFGCIHSFILDQCAGPRRSIHRYASCEPGNLDEAGEDDIAGRLAEAIVAASRRRTLPILGRTAIALSGGLDSRSILCGAEPH